MTLGSCSLKKRKMYVSYVAHFDTSLKHALANYMLKTTPFALLLNAPLDPYSIKRSLKKGDRMHLSKFNMIWSKLFICLTSATKDNYLNPPGARHKGKCRATQIFHISSSSSTCRHSLSVSGIKQTLWAKTQLRIFTEPTNFSLIITQSLTCRIFTICVAKSSNAVCQNRGLSQYWQCQDFESTLLRYPYLSALYSL